jgi:hypothetical protein
MHMDEVGVSTFYRGQNLAIPYETQENGWALEGRAIRTGHSRAAWSSGFVSIIRDAGSLEERQDAESEAKKTQCDRK